MAITIYKADDKFVVSVSPPEGPLWRSKGPMAPDEIFDKLIDLGCHTTDISDAFCAADPFWTRKEGQTKHSESGVLMARQTSHHPGKMLFAVPPDTLVWAIHEIGLAKSADLLVSR